MVRGERRWTRRSPLRSRGWALLICAAVLVVAPRAAGISHDASSGLGERGVVALARDTGARRLAVQPDGKTVVAAHDVRFRLQPDGRVDGTFRNGRLPCPSRDGCDDGARTQAAPFPTGGRLVFACFGCDGWHDRSALVTIGPDGRQPRVTPDSSGAYEPRWSPSGDRLAFTRFGQIWTSRADGSDRRRLTRPARADSSPAWFPTGTRLVFVRLLPFGPQSDVQEPTALWTIGVNGRGSKRLLSAPTAEGSPEVTNVVDPDVSPDGRRVAFGDVSGRLWVARSNGTGRRRLGPSGLVGATPRWSPDGTRVAYLVARTLRVLNVRTSAVRTAAPCNGCGSYSYAWSPDGRWFAVARSFESDCDDPRGIGYCPDIIEIWVVASTGGRERRIYRSSQGAVLGLDWRR